MPKFSDLLKQSSIRHWKLSGPERLIKVVSPTGQRNIHKFGTVTGYVTQEKFLIGKNCLQIEKALGLRPFELRELCYLYSLERLPAFDEVEFRLTCEFPDGQVFDGKRMQQVLSARDDFVNHQNLYIRSMSPVVDFYGPGSPLILQWELTSPIPVGGKIATVTRLLPFTNDKGFVA